MGLNAYLLSWEHYGAFLAALLTALVFLGGVPNGSIVIPVPVYFGIPVLFFLLTSMITWKRIGTTVLAMAPDFWYRNPAFLLGRKRPRDKNAPKNFDNYFIIYRIWFFLLLALFVIGIMSNLAVAAILLLHFIIKMVF